MNAGGEISARIFVCCSSPRTPLFAKRGEAEREKHFVSGGWRAICLNQDMGPSFEAYRPRRVIELLAFHR